MKIFALILFVTVTAIGRAAEPTSPDPFSDFFKPVTDFAKKNKLKLVGSTTDLDKSTAPATLSWTDSRSGGHSLMADVGLKLELRSLEQTLQIQDTTLIQPGIEYHRDTTKTSSGTDKQNSFIGGFTTDTIWNLGEQRLSPILQGAFSYKNDRVDKGQGAQASIGISGYSSKLWLNSMDRNAQSPLSWSPELALQWENKNGIAASASSPANPLDGNATRAKGTLAVEVWPFRRTFGQRIEFAGRFDGWLNLNRSGCFAVYHKTQRITTCSVNFWLNNDRNAGVGLDYSNGENPEKGKARDRSSDVALKMQFE